MGLLPAGFVGGRAICRSSKCVASGHEVTHHPLRLPRVRALEGSYPDDF